MQKRWNRDYATPVREVTGHISVLNPEVEEVLHKYLNHTGYMMEIIKDCLASIAESAASLNKLAHRLEKLTEVKKDV